MKEKRFILFIDKSGAYLDFYGIAERVYQQLDFSRKTEFVVSGLLSDYKVKAWRFFRNFVLVKIKRVRKKW